MLKFKTIFLFVPAVCAILSCNTVHRVNKNFNYFQTGLDSVHKIDYKPLLIAPNDILDIFVGTNSINREQIQIFNASSLPGQTQSGQTANSNGGASLGYLVDNDGKIRFPVLGMLEVTGKTCAQLSNEIQRELSERALVNEPTVHVRFQQIKINVLGEVKSPGTKTFSNERITLLDAIGAAGDLADHGRRDNIRIIREDGGVQRSFTVDIRTANFMYQEGYQLHQNDIVYVCSDDIKLREIKYNPNTTRDLGVLGTILSTVSFFVNIALFFK